MGVCVSVWVGVCVGVCWTACFLHDSRSTDNGDESKRTPRRRGNDAPRPPGFQASRLPGFQASRLPGFQASRLPGFQASRLPGFQASRLPGFTKRLLRMPGVRGANWRPNVLEERPTRLRCTHALKRKFAQNRRSMLCSPGQRTPPLAALNAIGL